LAIQPDIQRSHGEAYFHDGPELIQPQAPKQLRLAGPADRVA
jgi:hypothetical protein